MILTLLHKTQLKGIHLRKVNGVLFHSESMPFNYNCQNTVSYHGGLSKLHGSLENFSLAEGISRVFNFDQQKFEDFLPKGIIRKYAVNDRNVYVETRNDIDPSETYLVNKNEKYSFDEKCYGFSRNPIFYNDGYIKLKRVNNIPRGLEFCHLDSKDIKWKFDLPNSNTKITWIDTEKDLILVNCDSSKIYVIDRISGRLLNQYENHVRLRDCKKNGRILSSLSNRGYEEYDLVNGEIIKKANLSKYRKLDFYIKKWQKDGNKVYFIDTAKNRLGVFNYKDFELLELLEMPKYVEKFKTAYMYDLIVHEDFLFLILMLKDANWALVTYKISSQIPFS